MLQQQLNGVKESIGELLQAMRGQIVEVQKSQDKMWGAINRMGEELQGLAAKEDDLGSEREEEEAAPEYSLVEMPAPRTVTNMIPLFGGSPPLVHTDLVSVRDSVSSVAPKQVAPPLFDVEAG